MTKVILRRCENYDVPEIQAMLRDAIAELGGIPALRPGAKVLVKPNLLMRRDPERHTTTHPAVVEAVVRQLQDFINARYRMTPMTPEEFRARDESCRRALDILLYGILERKE